MKRIFLIFFIISFVFGGNFAEAQQRKVTVEVESLFGFEPLGDWYSPKSLLPVATYIESWRRQEPGLRLEIVDSLSWAHQYYINIVDTTLMPRVLKYLDAELIARADSLTKVVDVVDFPRSRVFEQNFSSDIMAIKRYFATPIAVFDSALCFNPFGTGDFQTLFHTFQCDVAGVDISLFSPTQLDSSLPSEVYIKDVVRLLYFDNDLVVVELTGKELRELVEKAYNNRYYQLKNHKSDLLKLRVPAYLHIGVSGVEFTLNLTKAWGRKIENWTFDNDKIYRVVMNSFLARELQVVDNLGDYKTLFIEWLRSSENYFRNKELVNLQPKRMIDEIKLREIETIFGKSNN